MKIADNVEVPRDGTEADMLLYVLDGWTSDDDWGMPSYPYPDTCRELLDALRAGDDPWALRRIGNVAKAHAFAGFPSGGATA